MTGTCGKFARTSALPCAIRAEIKNRSGKPRYWCFTHGAPAWDKAGEPLGACLGAGRTEPADEDVLTIDPADFPGGIAVWGAVDAILNTGPDARDWGVHVHARQRPHGLKQIDKTFRKVRVVSSNGPVEIDEAAATSYVVAAVFGLKLKMLRCPHCGGKHLDAGQFAATAHRKHQCNHCGRPFFDPDGEPSISNPLTTLRTQFGKGMVAPTPSPTSLSIEQSDFAGGLAIWGSNEAILWTAPRPEDTGIHVHAWALDGTMTIDDTFGAVNLDGITLDPDQVRILMVQQSLAYLQGRVVSLTCPTCRAPHFDTGTDALIPHAVHRCHVCASTFTGRNRYRKTVSNPLTSDVIRLLRNRS